MLFEKRINDEVMAFGTYCGDSYSINSLFFYVKFLVLFPAQRMVL